MKFPLFTLSPAAQNSENAMVSALRSVPIQFPGPPLALNKFLDSSLPQFPICTAEQHLSCVFYATR